MSRESRMTKFARPLADRDSGLVPGGAHPSVRGQRVGPPRVCTGARQQPRRVRPAWAGRKERKGLPVWLRLSP